MLLETRDADVIWGRYVRPDTLQVTPVQELLRPLQGVPAVYGFSQSRFENRFGFAADGRVAYSVGLSPRALPATEPPTSVPGWLDSLWLFNPASNQSDDLLARRAAPGGQRWMFTSLPTIRGELVAWHGGVERATHTDDLAQRERGSGPANFRGIYSAGSGSVAMGHWSEGSSGPGPSFPPPSDTEEIDGLRDFALGPDDIFALLSLRPTSGAVWSRYDAVASSGQVLLRQYTPVAANQTAGERWLAFERLAARRLEPCTHSHVWAVQARTNAAVASDSVIVTDRGIAAREGSPNGQYVIRGNIRYTTLSDVGDLLFLAAATDSLAPQAGVADSLFFNEQRIAYGGQPLTGGGRIRSLYPLAAAGSPKSDRTIDVYFAGEWENHLGVRADAIFVTAVSGSIGLCHCLADVTDVGDTGAGPDGQVTVDDLIAFVNAFGDATGCPGPAPCNLADLTDIGQTGAGPDGQLTVDDIIAFVNAFGEGC